MQVPDPTFHFNADLDPAFHFYADPDPAPYQGYLNLRPLAYTPWLRFKPPSLHPDPGSKNHADPCGRGSLTLVDTISAAATAVI
jgi:hypothetical protein